MNRPHTVPMIELTPEEQNRLPNFSAQSLSLFPDINQPDFNQNNLLDFSTPPPPNLADPFSSDLSATGLPQDWLAQSPFQRQTTQILPPPTSIPLDHFTGSLPPLPFLNQTPDSLTTENSIDSSTSVISSEETAAQSVDQTAETNAEEAAEPIAADSAQSTARETPEGLSELRTDELNQRIGNLGSWQIVGRTSGLLSLTPAAPDNESELALDPPGQAPALSFNNTERESLQARLQAYAYSAEGTSEAAASEALTTWTAQIQAESGIVDLQPNIVELSPIDNPVRVCLPQTPTSAIIGVLVNPEGQIIDPPRLLKSTGYGVLNNWAARTLGQSLGEKELSLSNPDLENPDLFQLGDYQAFSFEIPINYDAENCIDRTRLTLPNG